MQPLPLKASEDILSLMRQTYSNQGFQLFVSFFEIYGGKLFDLLNDKRFVGITRHLWLVLVWRCQLNCSFSNLNLPQKTLHEGRWETTSMYSWLARVQSVRCGSYTGIH